MQDCSALAAAQMFAVQDPLRPLQYYAIMKPMNPAGAQARKKRFSLPPGKWINPSGAGSPEATAARHDPSFASPHSTRRLDFKTFAPASRFRGNGSSSNSIHNVLVATLVPFHDPGRFAQLLPHLTPAASFTTPDQKSLSSSYQIESLTTAA
jgi:hypothetical protein